MIKYMTDGVLLRETLSSEDLFQYKVRRCWRACVGCAPVTDWPACVGCAPV